ncbi:MAG TPA: FHA domain-containing protein [Polyangia bacterium]|nr:FHA domain-containing protein [Polyangia bacterium]
MPLRLQVTALDDPQARVFRYEFDADRAQILLGRRGGVDVLLPHSKVSLVHARIERRAGDYFLVDDGSTNGTRLNGAPVPTGQRQPLRDGDRIAIGSFALEVAIAESDINWPAESSGSIARRMVREVLERLGPGESQPSLLVLDGPQTGVLLALGDAERTFVLGRASGSDLRLDDVDMWREHAALVRDAEGVTVRDVGMSPALTVNGERVSGSRALRDGDVLVLGTTSLRYHDPAEVYLRRLETPGTPDESEPHPAAPARNVRRRPELLVAIVGGALALAAAAALVYVLLW